MRIRATIAFTFAVLMLAGCAAAPTKTALEEAVDGCHLISKYVTIGDDGRSLTIEGEGNGVGADYGLSYSDTLCILDALAMPDSVRARMEQTRALDGMQTADWDDVEATWTYHPDHGLDIILSLDD